MTLKVYKSVLGVLLTLSTVRAQFERNDTCISKKPAYTGTCKYIDECPFAKQLISEYRKPEVCGWEDETKVICCPNDNLLFRTGILKAYFEGTTDGVLKTQDMTCRYDGTVPATCCQNKNNVPLPVEPRGCPGFPTPMLPRKDTAYTKCYGYQRYVHWCEANKDNPNTLNKTRKYICNIPDSSIRIAGGEPAARKEFPHMALLGCHRKNSSDEEIEWIGGASLISEKFLLTAGHVLHHNDHGKVRYALLGVTNRSEIRDGVLTNIIRRIPYKLYVKGEKNHDIALLELDRRIWFTEFIRPACLPMSGLDTYSYNLIAGWGRTDKDSNSAEVLLTTQVSIVNISECTVNLANRNVKWDDKTTICSAGTANRQGWHSDSCSGDSGGPLMVVSKALDCTYIIKGIVSWGPECGKGVPAIYTNVEYYVDWIVSHVWP